jgi:hypothetical protein
MAWMQGRAAPQASAEVATHPRIQEPDYGMQGEAEGDLNWTQLRQLTARASHTGGKVQGRRCCAAAGRWRGLRSHGVVLRGSSIGALVYSVFLRPARTRRKRRHCAICGGAGVGRSRGHVAADRSTRPSAGPFSRRNSDTARCAVRTPPAQSHALRTGICGGGRRQMARHGDAREDAVPACPRRSRGSGSDGNPRNARVA